MKLQSSIEFLTTYSFLFLLIGIIISFLFFFSTAPRAVIPGQCISLSGPACLSVQDYVNVSQRYSTITFSFSNAQPVPINVLGMTVLINTANSIASGCIPNVEYPGGTFTCVAAMAQAPSLGTVVSGFYTINTLYCNSGISSLQNNCTTGSNIQYSGSFSTPASSTKPLLFSVLTLLGPQSQQLPAFSTNPLAIPSGFTRIQSGGWSTVSSSYGFGSSAFRGNNFIGVKVAPFTLSTSALSNNNVACAGNYNSLLSMAYSIIYLPPPLTGTGSVSIYANNAIELYYASNNLVWSNAFGGAGWHGNFGANTYGPSSISFNAGINYVAVLWGHDCGPGVQVVNLAGLPGTPSTTSTTSTSSTSTSTTSVTTTSSIATTTSTTSTTTSTTSTTTTSIVYVYAIGGYASGASQTVYYAPAYTTGTGSWTATNTYPIGYSGGQCIAYNNYVYCTGGLTGSGGGAAPTALTYYAQLYAGAVGTWTSSTSYPFALRYSSCIANNGYEYCTGGMDGNVAYQKSYYASLSSGGVSSWTSTNTYPVNVEGSSCISNGGYMVCVGGSTTAAGTAGINNVYYAPVTSSGIGSWTSTNSYPLSVAATACTFNGGYMYCKGGYTNAYISTAYYAPVYGNGEVGSWTSTNSYGTIVGEEGCANAANTIYCIAGYPNGFTNADYYSNTLPLGTTTWTTTNTFPLSNYDIGAVTNVATTTVTTTTSTTSTTSIHYLAITLTNSGSTTPASYQQLVVVNSNTYSAYINPQWNNVEFSTGTAGTGTVLNAWVQTNAINTGTYTMVWVKIPAGVAAGSSTIYMDFMPSNIMSSAGPTGEASELSTSYGQYDNGNTVFAHYDSFIGSSLDGSKWTTYTLQGMASAPGLVTVSNSLQLNFGSTWWGADAYSNANFATTNGMALDYQFDWAAQSSVGNCGGVSCDTPGDVYLRNTGAGRDTTYYAEPGCPDVDIQVNIHNSVSTLTSCNGSVVSATASIAPSVGTWYGASLQIIPTSGGAGNAYFYYNGATSPTISVAIASSAYYPNSPLVIEYHTGNYNSGDQFFIRDSRLRVAVATPPTTSFGSVI
ncbi:MAG TPA: DUF2341 domain-containing protein [Candidatus Aquilonibacter sp.]|nr:DUF2341 domain-containing protein [Candidatus Aquilonibacter sp.]